MAIKKWQPGRPCNCPDLMGAFWPTCAEQFECDFNTKCLRIVISGITGSDCSTMNRTRIINLFGVGNFPSFANRGQPNCFVCQACFAHSYLANYPQIAEYFQLQVACLNSITSDSADCHADKNLMTVQVYNGTCAFSYGWIGATGTSPWSPTARAALLGLRNGDIVTLPFFAQSGIGGVSCSCDATDSTCTVELIDCPGDPWIPPYPWEPPGDPDDPDDPGPSPPGNANCANISQTCLENQSISAFHFRIAGFENCNAEDGATGAINSSYFANNRWENLNGLHLPDLVPASDLQTLVDDQYVCSFQVVPGNNVYRFKEVLGEAGNSDDRGVPVEVAYPNWPDVERTRSVYVYEAFWDVQCSGGALSIIRVIFKLQLFDEDPGPPPTLETDITLCYYMTTANVIEAAEAVPCFFKGGMETDFTIPAICGVETINVTGGQGIE